MADSCEGKIDAPLMYESGWGKKLSHIFAFASGVCDGYPTVVDVTKRYTRKFFSEEMQSRRAEFCSSEETLQVLLAQVNASWKTAASRTASAARVSEMERREKIEAHFLQTSQSRATEIETNAEECEGRLSGSLAWRASRDELGTLQITKPGKKSTDRTITASFHRESFLPRTILDFLRMRAICVPPNISNTVLPLHQAIVVSEVECAVGEEGLNIVIVDEQTGCILQSRLFASWDNANSFVNMVPDGRIIILSMIGVVSSSKSLSDMPSIAPAICSRLGGFPTSIDDDANIAFIGQVGFHPGWVVLAVSFSSELPGSVKADVSVKHSFNGYSTSNITLVEDHHVIPRRVFARLSEDIMPLATQLLASDEQKRLAAINAMKSNPALVGYVTKHKYPIYLFSVSAFPMQPTPKDAAVAADWKTCYYLPTAIAPKMDSKSSIPIEIPVNTTFFTSLFGQVLNRNSDSKTSSINVPTQDALAGKRLVALYFSEHWCPPCRSFTPMFSKFYSTLLATQPEALEVVFVSKEKDPALFQGYFSKMPWLAVPFGELFRKESLSSRYGIRGIPAVVVIDTISCTVICQEQARSDIMRGSQSGEQGVKDTYNHWLSLVPEESMIILESIKLSLEETAAQSVGAKDAGGANSYLVRNLPEIKPINPSELIKNYFTELVAQGVNPTTAAADAIRRVASGRQPMPDLKPGSFDSVFWEKQICLQAASLPEFKWTDGCCYFSDDAHISTFQPPLQAILCLVSTSMRNITGVQSVFVGGCRGAQHLSSPDKEGEWVELKLENEPESNIEIKGETNKTGIFMQSLDSNMEQGDSFKHENLTPFSLSVLPGYVFSGLHGAIVSTGITALGVICKKSHCSSSDAPSPDKKNKPGMKPHIQFAMRVIVLCGNDLTLIRNVVILAKKYLENAKKQPFNPKFRVFKLNNKVSDRMAQVPHGLDLLNVMHFSVFCSSLEYLVSLSPDLNRIEKAISDVEGVLSESGAL
eukprot:CAMPEP_0172438622 /NCGR_PEP_ID=MMETSP1064-20121228/72896_1 /TAXON_ID=202472 /ORGANISM="Aulacoseira subarctica , Strain CCAP 1002/5" /LENGTH=986 /DNA_ID=CAMNT_0013187185 /DNA_START=497 /DNA_END=3457 /DNA_ORIENTATION=-